LSRSLGALEKNGTIIAVVELSQSSWLDAGVLPGIERQPCKKLDPSPEPTTVSARIATATVNGHKSDRRERRR
jgi:hypothetical protein